MTQAFIISGARTPVGSFRGSFKSLTATDLGGVAVAAAIQRSGLEMTAIDEVIMGNVLQAGVGQAPARQAALKAGMPSTIAAVTVNKVCGSGLKAVMMAGQAIRCGDARAIVAGGMESMTNAPHFARGLREGIKLGDFTMVDAMVHDGLTCAFEGCHMGNHAEHIARKFQVPRARQDEYALRSQQLASKAIADGVFREEIVPVVVKDRKGDIVVDRDEGPRPDSSLAALAALKTVFDREGSVTAGNASTINDGAAAVVVVDEATSRKAPDRFRIVASHTSGTEPKDLFIAPVEAIRGAARKGKVELKDIDLFEINEAFAAQMLACIGELGLPLDRVNPHGGGIALGHPIGASGARVLVSLMYALKAAKKRLGCVSLCLGGGNAVAMIVERV